MIESARYHPFFCEENVWWLAQEPYLRARERCVVFIASRAGIFPMAEQRAGGGQVATWDYHVVLFARAAAWEVWDLDCTAGQPLGLAAWRDVSFPFWLPEPFRPSFRAFPAEFFISHFSSDRSHLRRADGSYEHAPPPWPAILDAQATMNLASWYDLSEAPTNVVALEDLDAVFD